MRFFFILDNIFGRKLIRFIILPELYNEKIEFKKAANYNKERQDCLEQLASVVSFEVEQENYIDDGDDHVKTERSLDVVTLQVHLIFIL